MKSFDGWYDLPRQVIEATETPFVTALYDRDPLPHWVDGRITVMGDAAHAMLPYHAQGAVQSIEDAWVLGVGLELGARNPQAALKQFEDLRYERANRMVQHSRNAEGWYHFDDLAARNDRFRKTNEQFGDDFTPQQTWLYSYDAEKEVQGTDEEWQSLTW
ncbi:MAG: FAD-dependent monooxygenase [Proteobacteria bacterium]|nr:FAD-dependent monooxygenase [Pseudomonadota bacterium]